MAWLQAASRFQSASADAMHPETVPSYRVEYKLEARACVPSASSVSAVCTNPVPCDWASCQAEVTRHALNPPPPGS